MKPPRTKVPAVLRSSARKKQYGRPLELRSGLALGPSCPSRSPGSPPAAPAALASSPSLLLPKRTQSASHSRVPGGPSAPPPRTSPGPAPAGWAAQRGLGAARTPAPEQRNVRRGRGGAAQAALQPPSKRRPRALPAANRGPRPPPPHRPQTPRARRREGWAGRQGSTPEVAIGRWRYAAPCRPGAPGLRSKVGRGLTFGAWSNISFLESDFNYLG